MPLGQEGHLASTVSYEGETSPAGSMPECAAFHPLGDTRPGTCGVRLRIRRGAGQEMGCWEKRGGMEGGLVW